MDRKPALESKLVEEFVGNAHGDFARVKELLEQEPALVNAAWDWGGGDFETALGAASHMGNRQIANFLLEHGARLDIFAAAMLGDLEVVKAALTVYPNAVNVPGPHGIPLIAHAEVGGEEAKAVLDYLKSFKG
ncbi:MAG: ankyrin repeat domain-containing protein [Chloroflexi bacterium]|nr:ankyrin repeat domain-containing protein [Chloroflexota bacterium]